MLKNRIACFIQLYCHFFLFFQMSLAYGTSKDDALKNCDALKSFSVSETKSLKMLSGSNRPPAPEMLHPLDTLSEWVSDCEVICNRYRSVFGEYPNLENPMTFSEKIVYKQLYDRRPILTEIADKIDVRNYVESRIGSQYLQEIYQIAKTPEEIEWSCLPSEFIVKTNHGSGWNIIVRDKSILDLKKTTSQLSQWLGMNYYNLYPEWCYKHIPPLVFVEKLMLDDQGKIPIDWKFFVFSGRALYLQVNIDRFENNKCNIYDRHLQKMDVRYSWDNFSTDFIFPSNIEEMFILAERLGEGLDFVRVDLYNINGRIFFGELTNYPLAGLARFYPNEFDKQLGECWAVPKRY